MSGIASIVLGFWGAFFPATDSGRHYLFIASLCCFLVASFWVWSEERKARIRLERESGPQVYMDILEPGPVGQHHETIRLTNEGNEPAQNVYFDEIPGEPIRLETVPRIVPVVSPTAPQDIIAKFAKELRRDAIELRTIAGHLGSEQRQWLIFAVWENPKGIRFRRQFRLERPPRADRVYCYPGVREVLG